MALKVRRVVSGHDENGNARVDIDELVAKVTSPRPGVEMSIIWTTEGFPVSNDGSEDGSLRETTTTLADGTVFAVLEFGPGVAPRRHRTDSIDYAVVISGEIDMELDGSSVHVKAGDVLVQRGAVHAWVNNGAEPCIIAFVIIASKLVTAGGKVLKVFG